MRCGSIVKRCMHFTLSVEVRFHELPVENEPADTGEGFLSSASVGNMLEEGEDGPRLVGPPDLGHIPCPPFRLGDVERQYPAPAIVRSTLEPRVGDMVFVQQGGDGGRERHGGGWL